VLAIFHSARLLLGLPSLAMLCVPQSFSGFCPSTLRMRNACEVSFTTAFAPCFGRILWYFTRCCRAEMLTHSKSTGAFVIIVCLETAGGDYRQTTITTH